MHSHVFNLMWNQYQIDQQIFHRDSHLVFHKVFATKRFVLDQPCRVMGLGSCSPVLPLRPQMIQRFQLLRLMVSARRFGLQEGLSWHWKFGLALSENNQKQDEQFHCSFFTLLLDMEQTPCCLLLDVSHGIMGLHFTVFC